MRRQDNIACLHLCEALKEALSARQRTAAEVRPSKGVEGGRSKDVTRFRLAV